METLKAYEQNALDFATKHGLKFTASYVKYGYHFFGNKTKHHIYRITLTRNKQRFTFAFGQSISAGKTTPSLYDVLSCLQKCDVGSYENFCYDFGYTTPCKALYNKVVKEYESTCRIFDEGSECFDELCEIQ